MTHIQPSDLQKQMVRTLVLLQSQFSYLENGILNIESDFLSIVRNIIFNKKLLKLQKTLGKRHIYPSRNFHVKKLILKLDELLCDKFGLPHSPDGQVVTEIYRLFYGYG